MTIYSEVTSEFSQGKIAATPAAGNTRLRMGQVVKLYVQRKDLANVEEDEKGAQVEKKKISETQAEETSQAKKEEKSRPKKKKSSKAEKKRAKKEAKGGNTKTEKSDASEDEKMGTDTSLELDALQTFQLYRMALEEDEVQLRFNLLSANTCFLTLLSLIRMACKKEAPSIYIKELFTKDAELGDFLGAIFSMTYDSKADEVGWTRVSEILKKYIEKHRN